MFSELFFIVRKFDDARNVEFMWVFIVWHSTETIRFAFITMEHQSSAQNEPSPTKKENKEEKNWTKIRKFLVLFCLQAWKMSLSFFHSPVDHVDFLHNLYFSPRTYTRCWWSDWLHMEKKRRKKSDKKFTHVNLEGKIGEILLKFSTSPEGRLVYDFFFMRKNEPETRLYSQEIVKKLEWKNMP